MYRKYIIYYRFVRCYGAEICHQSNLKSLISFHTHNFTLEGATELKLHQNNPLRKVLHMYI